MEKTQFFELNTDVSDLENVLSFLDALPQNIRKIFSIENSNFISMHVGKDMQYGITTSLFLDAFQESVDELESNLSMFRRKYKLEGIIGSNRVSLKIAVTLGRIGFTGESLKLKAAILNKLWDQVVDYANTLTNGVLDFANSILVRLLRKFLEYLNSILESLAKLILGAEGIKEFKDMIESYLGLTDD